MASDVVGVKNAGVGGEAGENGGDGVLGGPVEQMRERRPVRLVAEIGLARLSAGDDHAVEGRVPEFVAVVVEAVEVALSAVGAGDTGERVELDDDGNVAGSDVEQIEELQFRVFERGVGHVVDEGETDALVEGEVAVGAGFLLRPTAGDASAFDDQWHGLPLLPSGAKALDISIHLRGPEGPLFHVPLLRYFTALSSA